MLGSVRAILQVHTLTARRGGPQANKRGEREIIVGLPSSFLLKDNGHTDHRQCDNEEETRADPGDFRPGQSFEATSDHLPPATAL
jgi:hypothetical protein